MAIDNIIFLFY